MILEQSLVHKAIQGDEPWVLIETLTNPLNRIILFSFIIELALSSP